MNQPNQEALKFTPNLPLLMTFKFNQPKTGTGQYGEWNLYGVEHQGQDTGIFASEGLHDRLKQLGQLQGRTLEITKVVDETGKTRWTIVENGTDITPQNAPQASAVSAHENQPQTPPPAPQGQPQPQEQPNNYTRTAIQTLTQELENIKVKFQAMEKEIAGFRTLLVDLRGESAVNLHTSMTGKTKEEREEIPIPEQESSIDDPNLPK